MNMILSAMLNVFEIDLLLFFLLREMHLVVSSYNVNGIRRNLKRKSIYYFLKQKNHDVILLQETYSCIVDEKLWKCEWGEKIIYAHGTRW